MCLLSSCRASRDLLLNSSAIVTESLLPTALGTWHVTYTWHGGVRAFHLAAARTSNLSLKSWKVTRTGRQPWKSGPEGALLTPSIVTCLWMFRSSWKSKKLKLNPWFIGHDYFWWFPEPAYKASPGFPLVLTEDHWISSYFAWGTCKNWLKLQNL